MAWYGNQKLMIGTNHEPTPQAGEWVVGIPRARAAEAARCCQMRVTTIAASATSPKRKNHGLMDSFVNVGGVIPRCASSSDRP